MVRSLLAARLNKFGEWSANATRPNKNGKELSLLTARQNKVGKWFANSETK